mgnify:CR=1 FL=1
MASSSVNSEAVGHTSDEFQNCTLFAINWVTLKT